ncbi:MAG: tetratricopeptide repeat protein, partial [Pyrinomonadaceae bacterium]
ATLDHPYITRLIDGGTTDDGRPYFVMDCVHGLPLYRFADKNALSTLERLRLFLRIGEAVEYAHQMRVIHRDIKPSNILVLDDASPRLLDFGIAKLLDPDLASDTLKPTATALRMMTVDYASPEQVRGEKVTFATDVYSLGVVLYELLTGYRPYRVTSRAPHEIAKAICEEEPLLPSEVAGGAVTTVAVPVSKSATTLVGTLDPPKKREDFSGELRGDLDNILMKALHKEPANRYQTIAEFCADIERHLVGEPVDVPQYFSKRQAERTPSTGDGTKLLAVLPLSYLGVARNEDTNETYLTVGLADAIITRLASVRQLTVRPTSSITRYSDRSVDPLVAGRDLSVDVVLDGRIRRFGERLRISMQLLDVESGSAIWAGQFDERVTDVLELEDAISEHVVVALIPQFTGTERQKLTKQGTDNPRAFEAYMKGRFYWNQFNAESLGKAAEWFRKAAEIDPKYALAHVGIADFYVWSVIYGVGPSENAFADAEAHVRRAIELDDSLGEAYATLALIYSNRRQWADADAASMRAIDLAPNYPLAHEWRAAQLRGLGFDDEATREILITERLDPLSARTKTQVAWNLYQARNFNEALRRAHEVVELDSNYPVGYMQIAVALWGLGRHAEALPYFRRFRDMIPDSGLTAYPLCFGLVSVGRLDEAREIVDSLVASAKDRYVKPYFLAMCHAAIGDADKTFEYFEQAFDELDPWMIWFGTDPMLAQLRTDPRYSDLLRRMGNPIVDRYSTPKADAQHKSIAVLPLQILSTPTGSIDDEYLGVGLADAMITRLSQVKRLVVRPTSSVMKCCTYDDPLAITRDLHVDFVLCGTLRRVGDRVRISAQLLDVENESTVWADKFDENFTDILDLEDVVADKVARLLIPQLTGEEEQKLAKRGTEKPEAYEAYLKGRAHWLRSTPEAFAQALICYSEAIAIDPNYAAPYAGIADYHNFLSVFGLMAPHESFPAAKENAEKALSLDPELAEAYVSLAITAYSYDWNFSRSETLFEKAIDLSPNLVAAHTWYAHFLSLNGRDDEAEFHIGRANDIAPNTYATLIIHAFLLRNSRRYADSRRKLIEAHELDSDHYLAMQAFSWNVLGLQNFDEAEAMCRRAVATDVGLNMSAYALAFVLAAAGKRDEAVEIANRLITYREKSYVPPCYLALIFTALKEKDKALEWLETAFEERDCWMPWLAVDPRYDALRDDARFEELCRRIRHSSETSESIHQSEVPTAIFATDPVIETRAVGKHVVNPKKSTLLTRHKYKFALAGVLLALVSIAYLTGILTVNFYADRAGVTTANPTGAKRIVAIPSFVNETGNAENDFLCQGLSKNLIGRLQPSSDIQVIPTSAGLETANGRVALRPLGSDVQIDTIVVGRLIKYHDGVEIHLEFVHAATGSRHAAMTYQGKSPELASIENRMAADILKHFSSAPRVQGELTSRSYTQNSEAFELYLKGEYHRQKGAAEDVKKAVEFYRKALDLDANYALAHQGLALAYRTAPAYGTMPPSEAYPLAKESATKALTLDPTLGSAHIPLASIRFVWEWDFQGAEAEYRQALQIVPNNSEARYSYGNFLVAMGRFDEAINELKIAQQFDPLSPTVASNIAWAMYIAGRLNEAEARAKQLIARDPNFARAHLVLGEIYVEQGRFDEGVAAIERSRQISNEALTQMILGHALALAGRTAEARKIAADLEARVMKKEISPFLPVEIYVGLGDNDRAFYWLERAYHERSNWLALAKIGRRLKPLHGDPRFDDLLKRIGFPQ